MSDESTETTKPTGAATTIVSILVGLLLLSLASFYMLSSPDPVEEADALRAGERQQARIEISEEAKKAISTYAWADKEAQKVRMPVDEAMKSIQPRLAASKPSASGELAPLAPGPSDSPVLRQQPAPAVDAEPTEALPATGEEGPDKETEAKPEPADKEEA